MTDQTPPLESCPSCGHVFRANDMRDDCGKRAPDTQVAPSPPPRQATVCAPQCSVWPDCACGRATATCERCDDTGCPECDPEWAKHQVPASPQVAPDSLVARARAAAKHAQNGPFLRELAEGLEQLQRERDQAHDAVQRLTNGEPYDRILTAHAIANGIEMYMRRADVAESRLERVTQAARRYEWLRVNNNNPAIFGVADLLMHAEYLDAAIDDAIRAEKDRPA